MMNPIVELCGLTRFCGCAVFHNSFVCVCEKPDLEIVRSNPVLRLCGIHTHIACDEPDCRAVRFNPVLRLCGIHTVYAINPITVGNTQSRERCTTFTGGNTMCTGRCSRGCAECVEIALVVAGLRDPD